MSETNAPAMLKAGDFCWYELMTPNQPKAIEFFTSLMGWETEDMDMGPAGIYKILKKDGLPFGGCMSTDSEEMKDVPPHWMSYIQTDDVDASVEKIKSLGGGLTHGPIDIPNVGRFAVVSDPQNAHFTVFQSNESGPKSDVVPWTELHTSDREAAVEFYTKLNGWTTEEMDMGPMGTYTMFKNGEDYIAGCMNMPPEQAEANVPPHWMNYLGVDDLEASCQQVESLGGTIVLPITEIQDNHGKFAVIQDPTGAIIALHQSPEQPCQG